MIDSVNAAASPEAQFEIDYSWDAPDHPEQIYSRSDHYNYALAGIPVVFVFTGLHIDYHRVTDEPQYIDYAKLEKVTRFVSEIVEAVGNAAQRPRVIRR
jgi:Zn-dependent M28 family amino/carboxypeptidase